MSDPDAGDNATGRLSGPVPRESRIVIKITVLILTLGLLSHLAPVTAAAQDCITEIAVINSGVAGIQPPPGFTKIDVDLNEGTGGDFIYVCYKKGVGAPITGLAVTLDGGTPPSDAVYTRIGVNLNRGAGGDFIWLWYTKDPACTRIGEIHVQANTAPPPEGYTRINVDLNRNAGGAYVYLSYLEI